MNYKLILSIAILSGTIIGVGAFGIPYVISRVGFLTGIFYLLALTVVVLTLHLIFGEIILRTKEVHRLPGYAKKYLGNTGQALVSISTFIGIPFSLICYIIAGGEFLSTIFNSSFLVCSLSIWFLFSIGIILGVKTISRFEIFLLLLFALIIGIIFFVSLPRVNFENLTGIYLENLFLPYGVILFALAGTAAIPTIREILQGREKDFKKAIIIGTLIPALFYIIFSFAVVGVCGSQTSEEAISGLVGKLGSNVVFLGAIVGLIGVVTSFLVLGVYLRDVLVFDFKAKKTFATALVVTVPLIGVVLGKEYLILLMGLIGAVLGAFENVILLLISRKAEIEGNRAPEWRIDVPDLVVWIFCLAFIGGLIYEIFFFFG